MNIAGAFCKYGAFFEGNGPCLFCFWSVSFVQIRNTLQNAGGRGGEAAVVCDWFDARDDHGVKPCKDDVGNGVFWF